MMSLQNKIGAFVKLSVNCYWDFKLIGNCTLLAQDINPLHTWSTAVQSISYLYMIKSIKKILVEENDRLLDLGCGKGRMLLYCDYLYNKKQKKNVTLFGAEIHSDAFHICKNLCQNKHITIDNINALKKHYIKNNQINKILLFNPFNESVFDEFIHYLNSNIEYELSVLYINISTQHISILKKYNLSYQLYYLNHPLLGIWEKTNAIIDFNKGKNAT